MLLCLLQTRDASVSSARKESRPPLVARERYRDRKPIDRRADTEFLRAIWNCFGDRPFARGNLDAGRLSWLFGREIKPAEEPFDPESYEALLVLDLAVARVSFPEIFADEASR